MFFSAAAGLIVYDGMFKNKIYPNIMVGDLDLSGQSAEAAKRLINRRIDEINQHGIVFSYKNRRIAVMPVIASADGSIAHQLISFNADQAVDSAFYYGRNDDFFKKLTEQLLALFKKERFAMPILINEESVVKILKDNFSSFDEPAKNAGLAANKTPGDNYEFIITGEKYGKTIDYNEAIAILTANLANLNPAPIGLATITQYPRILTKDCLNIEAKAAAFLNLAPLALTRGEKEWPISQDLFAQMLALRQTDSDIDRVGVGLDEDKFKDYLAEEISSAIDQEPIEAKFAITDGRVTEFQNGQDGLALDVAASFKKIDSQLANGGGQNGKIELVVNVKPTLSNAGQTNNLGIKEIIGIGTSNFTGSPANRKHNIKVGSNTINGLLIKPGQEFSLNRALGKVGGDTGYLPELVIKENKTTPEYGGGLCQVGTTMFRAALDSGLPITMRRNHSYRVSYYEPAGTDATIYDPWPDFRFINDTPTHILIQTKVGTSTLAYEFWGTRDGRLVEKTKSTIYNIVKPAPAKIVETLDLKPGEKKCTEQAHNGADAYFDYAVTYPSGEVKKTKFSSHYVPWQEVCLLGVEQLSPPAGGPPDGTASSTPSQN
ncbi:MAG: VanW family protein [Patescibacteria group bacterium]|nr:VanW family protein [Patescibacteria group bacterium]